MGLNTVTCRKQVGNGEEVEFEMDVEVQTGLSGRNVGWDEGSWEAKPEVGWERALKSVSGVADWGQG